MVAGRLVTTLPSLPRQWRISHGLTPREYSDTGTSSLHVTLLNSSTHTEVQEDRVLSITFLENQMRITTPFGQFLTNLPPTEELTSIQMIQERFDFWSYSFKILINDREVLTNTNTLFSVHSDVEVFACRPGLLAQPGQISKIEIETKVFESQGKVPLKS